MAVRMYLSYKIEDLKINKKMYTSVLTVALRDSRRITGRDISTGKKLIIDEPFIIGCWLGILGYFSILDQIGKCFSNSERSINNKDNDIIQALRNFTDVSEEEIYALYALRCALIHEYSLFNMPKTKNKIELLVHRFSITIGDYYPLITLPKNQWNGNFGTNFKNDETIVNVEKFCDLVENIYNYICKLFDEGKLNIKLKGGSDELLQRFSFGIFDK